MSEVLPLLATIRVASPCLESWAAMKGDERVRHCDRCNLNVFNLSDMTRADAETLIAEKSGGRLCVRFFQRADGTIITRDCPVGLARIRWGLVRFAAGVAAAFAFVLSGSWIFGKDADGYSRGRLWNFDPYSRIVDALAPPPVKQALMGIVLVPPKGGAAKYLPLLRAADPDARISSDDSNAAPGQGK